MSKVGLALILAVALPLSAQSQDQAAQDALYLRSSRCSPCADLVRQYEVAKSDSRSLEALPLGERESDYDIALGLAKSEEASLLKAVLECAQKNCGSLLTPLESPGLIPLSEKDQFNRGPGSPVTAPSGENIQQVVLADNSDLVAISQQGRFIQNAAGGCQNYRCPKVDGSKAEDLLQSLANLEAHLNELLRALNEAEAAADAHHKSLIGTSGVTTANLINVKGAIIFHKTFHNIGSALLDLASILDFIQKAPEFLSAGGGEQLDSLYEALKDAESLINTIGTETGALEKEVNVIGGLATQPVDGAQAIGADPPFTDTIKRHVNDIKSDVSDLNELRQSIGKIRKALDEGKKAKDLVDDWKSVSRASGQFVGRILKRYSAAKLEERRKELEAKTESLVAETPVVLNAYAELQTITERQLATQDSLKKVREAREAMTACIIEQGGRAAYSSPSIPSFIDTFSQPGQPTISFYSWGLAFQHLNAQLPGLNAGIAGDGIGIVEGDCRAAPAGGSGAATDCPPCAEFARLHAVAEQDLASLKSLPLDRRDSEYDLTVRLAEDEVNRAFSALSECERKNCPSESELFAERTRREVMGPTGTGSQPWWVLSVRDARATDCPPCVPIAFQLNANTENGLFLESMRDEIRKELAQAASLRGQREAALRDLDALNRRLQAMGGGAEARVNKAALQGQILTLTSTVGKLNEEIKRLEARKSEIERIENQINECLITESRLTSELLECERQCQLAPTYTFIGIVSSTPFDPGGNIFTPPGVEQLFGGPAPPTGGFVADLGIIKLASVPQVSPGGVMFFDLRGTNSGPDPATDVVIVDPLPAGFTFQSFTSSQGSCNFNAPILNCDVGSLAVGASADIRINVVTGASATGTLTNTANIFSGVPDPSSGNNFSSVPVIILPPAPPATADLGIIKTAASSVVAPGASISYNFVASNAGPANATGVRVTDSIPAGLTFNNATVPQGTCQQAGTEVRCELGGINSGASVNFTLNFNVAQSASGSIANTAVISGDQTDPVAANNSSTATVTVQAPSPVQADLGIIKASSQSTLQPGGQAIYNLTVSNAGPGDATGVRIFDTTPSNLTFLSASTPQGSCQQAGAQVRCDLGRLDRGLNLNLSLTYRVSDSATGSISNTATVSGEQSDPAQANNSSTATVPVASPSADLSIRKTDSPDPVDAGAQVTYTITVMNSGPSAVIPVIEDFIPPGMSFVSSTFTGIVSCPATVCFIAPLRLEPFASITVMLTFQVAADAPSGTVTNRAVVRTTNNVPDPDPSDNEALETTTIRGRPASRCSLDIEPGIYFGSGGSCGVTSDATVSCTSPLELRVTSPNLNLVCDLAGACGDNNIVFGAPNHRCTIAAQGTGFRIDCEQLGTPNRCSQNFSPR